MTYYCVLLFVCLTICVSYYLCANIYSNVCLYAFTMLTTYILLDAMTVIAFLKTYKLDEYFKVMQFAAAFAIVQHC